MVNDVIPARGKWLSVSHLSWLSESQRGGVGTVRSRLLLLATPASVRSSAGLGSTGPGVGKGEGKTVLDQTSFPLVQWIL